MIYGVGTDIVSIDRIKDIIGKNRDGFIKRVLTDHEQALFANKADARVSPLKPYNVFPSNLKDTLVVWSINLLFVILKFLLIIL